MNLKVLLSDNFVDFSAKVADVHNKIKLLQAKYQADRKALTDEVEALNVQFQSWMKEQEVAASDKAAKVSKPTTV